MKKRTVIADQRLIHVSKYLSKHLRHQPERISLVLGAGGWVPVDELLDACAHNQFPISRIELEEVVARNDKQRFAFDATCSMIRVNQGHSVEVDLGLEPVEPPAKLYHGTAQQTAGLIESAGLLKMRRQHVHLSPDVETATRVGARHGRPVVFVVDADAMHQAGHQFYRAANGVWLIDHVPAAYLHRLVSLL